jgi:hypothetical protein
MLVDMLTSLSLLSVSDATWPALAGVVTLLVLALLVGAAVVVPRVPTPELLNSADRRGIGVGTVRSVDPDTAIIDVENVSGQVFTGRLRSGDHDHVTSLRPGTVLLVTFDPHVREQLRLADDLTAVRTAFDPMLLTRGLLTDREVDLIRYGVKTTGVVTGARVTDVMREDHRELVVDLMVTRPGGGQFPAHEITFVPASALPTIEPGSVIDVHYRPGQESEVALCVPPGNTGDGSGSAH